MGCLCSRGSQSQTKAGTGSDDDSGEGHGDAHHKRVSDGYPVYSMEIGQDGHIHFVSPVIKFVDSKGSLVQEWSMYDLKRFSQAEPDFIFSFETNNTGATDVRLHRFIVKGDMANPSPPDLSIVLNRMIEDATEPDRSRICTYSTLQHNGTCPLARAPRRVGWGAPDYAQLRARSELSDRSTDYMYSSPMPRSRSLDPEYAEPDEWSCESSQENLYSTLLNTRDNTYETVQGIQPDNIDAVDVDVDEEIDDHVYALADAAPQRLVFTTQGVASTFLLKPTRSRVSIRRRARGLTVRRERASSRRELTRSISSKF